MTPREFGQRVRAANTPAVAEEKRAARSIAPALVALAATELEKEAGGGFRAAKAILSALGSAGKTVDQGAGKLLGGLGGIFSGFGHAGRAVGVGAQAAGRGAQQLGSRLVNNVTAVPNRVMGTSAGGVLRDMGRVTGHAAGAAGSAASLAGKATKLVGEGAQGLGKGLNWMSNIPGLRTLAAAPVVAGGAMAARPYIPSVGLQSPVSIDMPEYHSGDVSLRNPITLKWGE